MTTTDMGQAVKQARADVSRAVHKASPFVEKFARLGYASKGVIYVIVGALAAMSAFSFGGDTTGSRGAKSARGGWGPAGRTSASEKIRGPTAVVPASGAAAPRTL